MQRSDDYAKRRAHLSGLSDQELDAHFWRLVDQLVAPLVDQARTHTSPSIERSVLLRMGFSSLESKALVEQMGYRDLLRFGAGQLLLRLAQKQGVSPRDAGLALLDGRLWDELDFPGAIP